MAGRTFYGESADTFFGPDTVAAGFTTNWLPLLSANAASFPAPSNDPFGIYNSASESGGIWTVDVSDAGARTGWNEIASWVFAMPAGWVAGQTGIAFRITPQNPPPPNTADWYAVAGIMDQAGVFGGRSAGGGMCRNGAVWQQIKCDLNSVVVSTTCDFSRTTVRDGGSTLGSAVVEAWLGGAVVGLETIAANGARTGDLAMVFGVGSRVNGAGNPAEGSCLVEYQVYSLPDPTA